MSPNAPKRMLLVDDEEDLVWSIKSRLSKAMPELVVDGVSQPELAARWLGERAYDLVVSDIRMPKMSGIELLIRARSLHPSLPFIVITAFPSEQGQREAMRLGSVTYIEKPFQVDVLLAAIREQLQGRGTGFTGALQLDTLPDLVQLFTLSNASGMLRIWDRENEGAVWFDRGAIVAAKSAQNSGAEAFYEILSWAAGQFAMERQARLPERTIFDNTSTLLIEAYRLLDDARRGHAPGTRHDDGAPGGVGESLLAFLRGVTGYRAFAIVDAGTQEVPVADGDAPHVREVALSQAEVLAAQRDTMFQLSLDDEIEDVVCITGGEFQVVRPVPASERFLFLAVDREVASLGAARMALRHIEQQLLL